MRKIVFVMSIVALCMFGCSESDDELQIENEFANEMSALDFERVHDMIQLGNAKLSSKSTSKSENNGNGVYIVPFYSDSGRWRAFFPITDTRYMVLEFPQNGEDRALVFSETEMMVNFTSHDPRLYIVDLEAEAIIYDNWCDRDRSGLYKARIKTTYIPVDWNEDGVIDYYWWGPGTEGQTVMDKNGIFHVKATLTAGRCNVDGEPVAFSYTIQAKNGREVITTTMR